MKISMEKKNTTGNELILFVDDEEIILDVCQRMLKRMGYRVVIAKNGKEALNKFKDLNSIFDLLITDVYMPYMTGIELAKNILKLKPEIPVILFTGYKDLLIPEKMESIGIYEILTKPFTQKEMASSIKRSLYK